MRARRTGETPARYNNRIVHIRSTVRMMPPLRHRRAEVITLAAQACDAAGAFHPAREIEVLANRHIGKSAESLEGMLPYENRLISRTGAADARTKADQRANQHAQRMIVVEANIEAAAYDCEFCERGFDIAPEGQRHNRVGMHEDQHVT